MEQITIAKIGRKDMPSKFKEGETYKMTTVMDDQNRKLTGFGKWTEGWKKGDVVDVIINEKTWKDKDGFDQVSLNLDNPNKKEFVPRAGGSVAAANPVADAYNTAATFAIAMAVSGTKKKFTLADLDKIADHIKSKTEAEKPAEEKKEVPTVDVETEVKKPPVKDDDFDEEEDDEEDPF